ncbi:cobalt ABC transporter permease [Aliiruegeria sabulilitoris]|uniref:cobalt ABC transporter permease n=1 Tax=Aliiruegeria sabulilitoris TaxID=1510458 RepID=UPI00082BA369|nr:cobalt ABC transporter permease [Aliiruegeria sabulilitoris]NDR59059.1 cobalt ABC transporter permease [Pseudoruegeria sp. M32A2M]
MIRPALLALAIALAALPALAHKVIMGVFPSGSQIEGELGFSGGDAPEGQLIEVFDEAGNKLGETVTDADGFFLFTPTEPVAHRFNADMGAGHVAETVMPAEEVAQIVARSKGSTAATIAWADKPDAAGQPETSAPDPAGTAVPPQVAPQVIVAALNQAELEAIAKVVRDETRPLRQEIAAYKEKNDLQTILGGIGYILGLFGLGFYIAARRKLKDAA